MHIPTVLIFSVLVGFSKLAAAVAQESPRPSPVEKPGDDLAILIRELGDESYQVREKASLEIWKLGETVVPALEEAIESSSPERVFRAHELLRKTKA